MFEFLSKAMSGSSKPSTASILAELGKNEAFSSLTDQARKDVMGMLSKASEVDLFDALHKLKAMTADSRDQVIAKLLHPQSDAAADTAPTSESKTHTVQPGDSLSKIAKAHGVSLKQVIAANPQVKNPDLIHPREVINLP